MTGWENLSPAGIERRSMEIIESELGETAFDGIELAVLKRVIHATADFSYAENLFFSENAAEKGIAALLGSAGIFTDTGMANAGINKKAAGRLGCRTYCFMAEEAVAEEAARRRTTRAAVCIERAALLPGPLIIAVGNAPTALLRLSGLIAAGEISPALVVAAPVGFVNVEESKRGIEASGAPVICARGRRGGSAVAAAICNALLYEAVRRHGDGESRPMR